MPNWTYNRIRVRSDNSEKIKEIKAIFEREDPFNALIPEPDWTTIPLTEETLHRYSFSEPRGKVGECSVMVKNENPFLAGLRFPSTDNQDDRWYEWRCDNWGTKWEACDIKITQDYTDFLEVTFNTAWSPPEPIAEILRSKYECNHVEDYHIGLYLSINWFYELEGEEGVGYLE